MEILVPIPRFSSEKLSVWFAQVEAAFAQNGVTSDEDKFDLVITHIPINCTTLIEDIILNPPEERRYELIKHEFIKRMAIYYMKIEELGNKKPSEYLHRLRTIGNLRVSNETIMNIWLNNLPLKVREIVSLETSGNVDTLCRMADKAMALLTETPQVRQEIPKDQFEIVLNRIDELAKQIKIVQLMMDGEGDEKQSQGQSRLVITPGCSRNEASNGQKIKNDASRPICWYHTVFGERAVACVAPCHYNVSSTQYHRQ